VSRVPARAAQGVALPLMGWTLCGVDSTSP
jgi:hypothetical protein